MPRNKDHSF